MNKVMIIILLILVTSCSRTPSVGVYNLTCYQNGTPILQEIVTRTAVYHARTYPGGQFIQVPYDDSVICTWIPVQ